MQNSSLHLGLRKVEGLTQGHTAARHRAGAQKPGPLLCKASYPVPAWTLVTIALLLLTGPHLSHPPPASGTQLDAWHWVGSVNIESGTSLLLFCALF